MLSASSLPVVRATLPVVRGGLSPDRISYEVFGPDLWAGGALTV